MRVSPSHMFLHNVHLFFARPVFCHPPTEPTFNTEEDSSPFLLAPVLEANRRMTVSALMGRCCVPMVFVPKGRISCGKLVLEILAQNKAIFSWCVESETTTARSIVDAVGGVVSMF